MFVTLRALRLELGEQVHEPVGPAAASACRERGLPFRQLRHDRRDYRAGVQAEISRQAVGAADLPRMVSKVLPHNALRQFGVHYRAV